MPRALRAAWRFRGLKGKTMTFQLLHRSKIWVLVGLFAGAAVSQAQDVTIGNGGVVVKQPGGKTVIINGGGVASVSGQKTGVRRSVTAGAALALNGNRSRRTYFCRNSAVTINGNDNHITLSGTCRALTISGNRNWVKISSLASLSTPGNDNKVVWSRGVGRKSPLISNLGNRNSIRRG